MLYPSYLFSNLFCCIYCNIVIVVLFIINMLLYFTFIALYVFTNNVVLASIELHRVVIRVSYFHKLIHRLTGKLVATFMTATDVETINSKLIPRILNMIPN